MGLVFSVVLGCRLLEPSGDFDLETLLLRLQLLVRPRLLAARVRFDLGAIESERPDLHQPRPRRHLHDLDEQLLERIRVLPPKPRDRPEVRLLTRGDHAKRDVLFDRALDLARGEDPRRIRVHQQRHHKPRVIRDVATAGLAIPRLDRRQIELVHDVDQEVDQVVLRKPLAP